MSSLLELWLSWVHPPSSLAACSHTQCPIASLPLRVHTLTSPLSLASPLFRQLQRSLSSMSEARDLSIRAEHRNWNVGRRRRRKVRILASSFRINTHLHWLQTQQFTGPQQRGLVPLSIAPAMSAFARARIEQPSYKPRPSA